MQRSRLTILVLLLLLTAARGAEAQSWDPFPPLPSGEHLAVKQGLDSAAYDNLRTCLRRFDSGVGASYFTAIVDVTSSDGSPSPDRADAVPYVDALYQAWLPSGRLDPTNHVLTVLSLRNRAIAVHPGKRWADLGFEGAAIRRAIDGSSFGDYARSGDYGLALCDLALTIDRQLAALAVPAAVPRPEAGAGVRTRGADLGPRPSASAEGGGGLGGCGTLLLFPLFALGLLALVHHFRRRRAKTRTVDELARWKEKIEVAAERVLAIETEHPLYFATTAERFTGDSQELDQEAADAVNYVFLLYSKAFELHDQADRLVKGAGGWSVRPLEEAWKLLRETEVKIETGEAEERRRIFLPLRREYQGSSANLLDDLGAAYGAAYDKLGQVVKVAENARGLAERAGQAAAEALQASNRRGELDLPVEHLNEALDPVLERRLEADRLVATDPIAAAGQLEAAITDLGRLAERARQGNAAIEAVRGPILELGKKLRGDVGRLREAGFRLAEPGFDPDLRLDHGVAEARRIEELLAGGEEEQADRLRSALETGLVELGEQLEAVEAARAGVPRKLEELENARRELAGRAPEAEEILRSLQAEHALEAFRDEADNLKELQALLGRLDEWFEQIREDHREERYLSALADLESAGRLLDEGLGLIDAIGEIKKQLVAARDGAKELAYRSQQLLARLDERVGHETAGIGVELRRSITELTDRTAASLEETGGPRPQWLRLEAALGGAEEELRLTVAQVEKELEAYGASERQARELDGRLAGLERQVSAETRDRSHVGRAVDEVERQLAAWKARLAEPDFSGSELERQGREIAASLDQARGAFDAEMDLVRLAETRFRATESLLRQVDGRDFGYGVVADCRAGRQGLRRVEEAWRNRDWEAAVSLAEETQERIEAEHRQCRDRASMLEQEARRRLAARREAERRASMRRTGGRIGGAMGGLGGALGGRRRSTRSIGMAPAIGSSRSSFGSKLGRSISSGSSFGGSRSGGSSW